MSSTSLMSQDSEVGGDFEDGRFDSIQSGSAQRPTNLPPLSQTSSQSSNMDTEDLPPSASMPFLRHQKTRNAHSKSITKADGIDTHGALNRHPAEYGDFSVGVQDAQGARMTMEDAYSFVVDFGGIRGQGFFAIFDGHAGPEAAEWCGNHFHEQFLTDLKENPVMPIPDIFNKTFLAVDTELSSISEEKGSSSGCTAVTAFLRVEDSEGRQSFIHDLPASEDSSTVHSGVSSSDRGGTPPEHTQDKKKTPSNKTGIRSAVRSLASSVTRSRPSSPAPTSQPATPRSGSPQPPVFETSSLGLRRVLYTANAGDARAVLCRSGKALRLTYDHKGADRQEAKRIQDAGGFVLNNRVNGVLAVTRSLGDSSMKEFVVGSPYTTETPLGANDEFLILACDGLWDVATDQKAVDLIRDETDCDEAARMLMEYALDEGTRDNVTILVVRFNKSGR